MVLRTAGRGVHQGEQFWGCSRFPACRGRAPAWGRASRPCARLC